MAIYDKNDESLEVLSVRQDAFPELIIEISEARAESNKIFEVIEDNARFEIDDITIGINEGEVWTTEPSTMEIKIISNERNIELNDINHIGDVLKSKYTVFGLEVAASIEREPEEVGIPEEVRAGFTEEKTEL